MPVSNPGTRQLSQVARSQFAVSKFHANFTAAIESRLFGIVGHNLSTSGKVRVRGYSTDPRAQVDRSTQVAVCDIDLAGGFPASSVSCTRSTTATYFDSDLVLRVAAINTPRFTYDPNTGVALGLLVESTVTNAILWSRDFTNAAWTKTNMTTAQTATGADGAANSATRLTATAANATVTQVVVLGSNAYASVLARRVSGSGNVQLTGDNFTTATTLALTASWKRFWILGSLSTETFGVKIVTSGDVVELDFAQFEAGSGAAVTSPIPTTTAAAQRVGDSVTINIPSHLQASSAAGSWVVHVRAYGRFMASAMTLLTVSGTGSSLTLRHDVNGYPAVGISSADAMRSGTVITPDSDYLIAANYANASHDARFNGSTGVGVGSPATSAGALNTITSAPAYAGFAFGRLTFFSATQDASTLTTFSTPVTPPTAGYDSGQVDAWHADWVSGTTAEQRSGARGVALVDAGSVQSYQYWRTDLIDPTNTAGYVQLGRVFMGSSWAPDHGMLTGASIGYESRSVTTEADDGAEYHDEKRGPLVVRFNLEAQTQNEAMLKILEMQRTLGTTGELLFIWDSADTLYAPYRTFLGRLRSLTPITAINSNLWSAAFEVKEAL